MKQRHVAYPIFHVEDMTKTDNCESSIIPEPQKPSLTTTPTTTQDDTVEIEVNGKVGTTVFVNGVDSGKTIDSTGKVKVTLDTSGDDGDKSFSISLKDSAGNESEALSFTIKKIHMRSCQSILDAGLSNGNGIYTIDPDGDGGNEPFKVYCDMTTDGGGWTYIANISDSDSDKWSEFYPELDTGIWANLTTLGNNITIIKDYKSRAYNEVPATSLLIKEGERRNVLITEANCYIKQIFRDFIASLTWNAEGSDQNWADNSGAYHCDYTDFGYNDPVLRASIQTNKKLLFKWGEKDGVQDQNKDRTMITTPNANNSNANVDFPTGLGGFTSYGVNMNYKDANECQADGPDQCSSHTEQNYQLFIRHYTD